MFAVIFDGRLLYAGHSQSEALLICEANFNSKLIHCESVAELEEILAPKEVMEDTEDFSQLLSELVAKLDELGINEELADRVIATGEEVIGEIKAIGSRGMKTVGEGFIALGELLRGQSETDRK